GLRAYQARALVRPLLEDGNRVSQASGVLLKLWRLYQEGDCSLAEINPLAITPEGRVLALDAKVILDDNAEVRHHDWDTWRDPDEESPAARLARKRASHTSSSTATSAAS